MRPALGVAAAALVALLPASVGAQRGRGADVETRFQNPAEERRVSAAEGAGDAPPRAEAPSDGPSLEDSLYLRERPDALGEAAREHRDELLERLLAEREQLVGERREEAIRLLEEFIAEEPEEAVEMPDALLRLAELRWEDARARYLEAFAAWQEVPPENRGLEPSPDYAVSLALYDRILERHPDFDRVDLVLYMKAFALIEGSHLPEALDLYRRILRDFPRSRFVPDAHMALAEARFQEGDFAGALTGYEEVLRYEESELFGLALFKSAWCLWRTDRSREAATRFRRVLDLGRGRGQASREQRRRLRELQDEALEYLIQVFTEDESNTARDVFAFLEEIGGERYADRVLISLSARFYDQDRWENGIEAYRLVLERSPGDERAPRWQLAIARGQVALGDSEATVAALELLATDYLEGSAWAEQQSDPQVVEETRELVERSLRRRALRWHDLGQQEDQIALFQRAERLYGIYLEHFPASAQSYNIRFYRGEILFHRLERYEEAGAMYLSAAQAEPEGRYTRDALYNAIGAFERVRETQLTACEAEGGGGSAAAADDGRSAAPGAGTEAPGADAAAPDAEDAEDAAARAEGAPGETALDDGPCGETENDRRFSEAIALYVELFPNDPDLPEILFRQGRLYYDRGIYDPAVRLFGQLLERFPQSPYAVTAGELILESFQRAEDYRNIETWARRLKSSAAFQTAESQRRLDALILQAVFATGEQLAGRGEHREAAEAYLRAAREFPADERTPQALYNAGLEYQRAGDLPGAGRAYEQLIAAHPGTAIGAQGAWAGAQMYESIAQFRDAARFYEAYGERFGDQDKAEDALFNATLLRVTAGDHGEAVRDGQRFLERYPRTGSAPEVTFLIARAHAAAGSWAQAADVYARFIRRSRDLDRQVEAYVRRAEALREAGDGRQADQSLARAVAVARRNRRRLGDAGLYYAAKARFLQAQALVVEFEAIAIQGSVEGLRERLQQKSTLLRRAAEAFANVVEYQVAEFVTAALFQIGRSYELFAEGLRDAPVPEGLSEEEEMAYFDQLSSFVIPIEERALEAYEGGYQTALELRIFNRWTAALREGLTRLNDVAYPPLREMGGDTVEGVDLPGPQPLDGLRRGPSRAEARQADDGGGAEAGDAGAEEGG